jgi:hypothetical protein
MRSLKHTYPVTTSSAKQTLTDFKAMRSRLITVLFRVGTPFKTSPRTHAASNKPRIRSTDP